MKTNQIGILKRFNSLYIQIDVKLHIYLDNKINWHHSKNIIEKWNDKISSIIALLIELLQLSLSLWICI